MDIEYFKSHIAEELEGAKDYIIRAIEIKPMEAQWSKILFQMSAEELNHATHLYNMFNEYCKIMGTTYTQLPEYVLEAREEITKKYAECMSVIKHMHEMYK